MLNERCELCGAEGNVQMHHVRKLADLKCLGNATTANLLRNPIFKGLRVIDERRDMSVKVTKADGRRGDRPKIKGKVDLVKHPTRAAFLGNIELTEKIVDALDAAEMPPEDEETQPSPAERITSSGRG